MPQTMHVLALGLGTVSVVTPPLRHGAHLRLVPGAVLSA